jgi:hypothetical protein
MQEFTFYLRASSGAPVVKISGASKTDAYIRHLMKVTNCGKHGVAVITQSYIGPRVDLLDKDCNAWPIEHNVLSFLYDQEEYDEHVEETS